MRRVRSEFLRIQVQMGNLTFIGVRGSLLTEIKTEKTHVFEFHIEYHFAHDVND